MTQFTENSIHFAVDTVLCNRLMRLKQNPCEKLHLLDCERIAISPTKFEKKLVVSELFACVYKIQKLEKIIATKKRRETSIIRSGMVK